MYVELKAKKKKKREGTKTQIGPPTIRYTNSMFNVQDKPKSNFMILYFDQAPTY